MANVQKQFENFHDTIKLGRFEENAILREKRDIIREKLENQLPGIFDKYGEECPDYSIYDQGSYDLGTGIQPCEGDYDIDQGLYFGTSSESYPDPVVLKHRVFEALEGHTTEVRMRHPCVTVFYKQDGRTIYHVDVAIYSDGSKDADSKPRLARGKQYSTEENRYWEVSDQFALKDALFERFIGSDRDQFRRIVRYLKRWKDQNFSKEGNCAPRGIALTIAVYNALDPVYLDQFSNDKPDDLTALRNVVRATLGWFRHVWDDFQHEWVWRLVVTLPVEPGNDLFGKMTNLHMANFRAKLEELLAVLDRAASKLDPIEACEELRSVFGEDFPVPVKEETAKKHAPAIISSSSSA